MSTAERPIWKELFAILSEEELIRLQRRAARAGNKTLARLLETELAKRGRG